VLVGAVLVVNAVEVLGGIEEVVLNDVVIEEVVLEDVVIEEVMLEDVVVEEVMLEDEAELLDDVVATVDSVEDVLDGTKVETVAPKVPRVTISVLKGTWNRPIPESQHPLV
jgi:hypothetical protein